MSHAELERLADPSVPKIKVSRGDIAMAISKVQSDNNNKCFVCMYSLAS